MGIGTIEITVIGQDNDETELQLNNVIYAPTMHSNLFSLGTAYDLGYETRITPGKGLRVFHKDTVVIQTIREESGLFRIIMAPQTAHAKAAQIDAKKVDTVPELDMEIWHRRMGHLNEDYVRKLRTMADGIGIKARTTVGDCDACMEGKQNRQPSHKPATRAKEALELIHSDLCGPISPTTYGRPNKGKFKSTKFGEEDFSKKQPTAKIARTLNPDSEDEPKLCKKLSIIPHMGD